MCACVCCHVHAGILSKLCVYLTVRVYTRQTKINQSLGGGGGGGGGTTVHSHCSLF